MSTISTPSSPTILSTSDGLRSSTIPPQGQTPSPCRRSVTRPLPFRERNVNPGCHRQTAAKIAPKRAARRLGGGDLKTRGDTHGTPAGLRAPHDRGARRAFHPIVVHRRARVAEVDRHHTRGAGERVRRG